MVIAIDGKRSRDSWYLQDNGLGTVISCGQIDQLVILICGIFSVSQGHATWTGSVLRDSAGLWRLFYTGSTRARDELYQRIGHATSNDGHSWVRLNGGLCLDLTGPLADLYEKDHATGQRYDRAMRDPDSAGWLMYFIARASGIAEASTGGAFDFTTSDDLTTSTLQPPIFTGGFGQLEVPHVYRLDALW